MLAYTLRRILLMIPTLLVISFVTFVIIQLPPGDYLTNQIAELRSQGDTAALAKVQFLRQQFGLDKSFLEQSAGMKLVPYLYLGAKHMVSGYDHLLFLVGVIFFLYKIRDVALYVTLFSLGHSTTLLIGVLGGIHANPYIVDAIRNFTVTGTPSGFDLPALDIQRGRDDGLPGYNQVRIDYGLTPKASFAEMTSPSEGR